MARLGFVDRDDLVQWGRAQGAPADLPDLVRQLILETTPGVVSLGFAVGAGVYSSGWDGTVKATTAGLNVPAGLSLWELSTRGDVNVKADEDYDKRSTTPDGTPTTQATYVAVSTRTWQDRADWARAKREQGRWAGVNALGVDDLDTWLKAAPVTHAWLSEKLGFQPHGLITTQAWWERFAHETQPALPTAFVLAGRDKVVEALGAELARPGQLITIAGASREDVLAFVAAMAIAAVDDDGGALLARAAYVDRIEAYRRWQELKRPLLLAAANDDVAHEMSAGTAHHLIVPVVGGHADFDLPPIDAQLAAKTLQDAGIAEELAAEVGGLARLSLLASRRRIAVKPELHRPPWAQPPVARIERRVTLLGRFSENAEGDVEVVEEACAASHATIGEEIAALSVGDDPLLVRLGASIGTVSQLDAWLLLAPQMRKEDYEAFHVAALKVLTEFEELTLTDAPIELDDELRRYFEEKTKGSLKERGLQVVADETAAAVVRDGVAAVGRSHAALVDSSRAFAEHLYELQNRRNPPGLLAVATGSVDDDGDVVAILKLEREKGLHFTIAEVDGRRVVDLEFLRRLTLTDKTRIFKTAVLRVANVADPLSLFGSASDDQRSRDEAGVANFFLASFLGCKLRTNPAKATKDFVLAAQRFIKVASHRPGKSARA